MEEPQGTLMDCVYCTRVHPDLGVECPRCHGDAPRFRPARMMDGPTARAHLLEALGDLDLRQRRDTESAEALKARLLTLLEDAVIHGFDLTDALSEEVRRLEEVES